MSLRIPILLFRYIWAFPNTAIGLFITLPTLLSGGGCHWVRGVLEVHGGFARYLLTHWTLLPDGAAAMTLGHVVIGRDEQALHASRSHERIHVRQYERWGPLFIPTYLLFSFTAYLRGRDAYRDNPFEAEAYKFE